MQELKNDTVFTENFVLHGGEKIPYSQLTKSHPVIKDPLSFRLGVIVGTRLAQKEYARKAHETA